MSHYSTDTAAGCRAVIISSETPLGTSVAGKLVETGACSLQVSVQDSRAQLAVILEVAWHAVCASQSI